MTNTFFDAIIELSNMKGGLIMDKKIEKIYNLIGAAITLGFGIYGFYKRNKNDIKAVFTPFIECCKSFINSDVKNIQ